MPPICVLTGGVDFSDLYINLSGGDYGSLMGGREADAVTINLGVFINISFASSPSSCSW